MKALQRSINWMALGFAILMAFQSCTVYKKLPVTAEQAIATEKPVLIKRPNGQEYKFKKIVREDNALVGYAKTRSETAKLLKNISLGISEPDNLEKIDLDALNNKQFYPKNDSASFWTTVILYAIPVVPAVLVGTYYLGWR